MCYVSSVPAVIPPPPCSCRFLICCCLAHRWLNYQECKPQIQQLLDSRSQGETVQEFNVSAFSSHAEVMRFWSTQVRAVIGPHGGAFYNLFYASSPTAVLEIWPVSKVPVDRQQQISNDHVPSPNLFWEISHVRQLQHWVLPMQSVSASNSDVVAECGQVVAALQQSLQDEAAAAGGPVLEPFYQGTRWSA
jgi:hypothetical protein